MNSHRIGGGSLPLKAVALALGALVWFDSSVVADDNQYVVNSQGQIVQKKKPGHHDESNASAGTLGYGPPGLFPGFQGFGLGYHLGYGYGGGALGVGAEGGYPFYGGPGYPHPEPTLRRFGPITPFTHYMGPGYPTPDHPNYYGGVGPLVPDQSVVTIATDTGAPIEATGYGPFTGAIADPEALFAPFTARAAAGAATMERGYADPTAVPTAPAPTIPSPTIPPPGAGFGSSMPATPPATSGPSGLSALGRSLGIEEEPVVAANGARGIKIATVLAGAAAEKAGLHAGDVIYSTNGYLTQTRGNLVWVINHAAPTKVLTMRVSAASDGKEHVVTAQLR